MMKKVCVAIPSYDGKVCHTTNRLLLEEQWIFKHNGIQMDVHVIPGQSLVHSARNVLAHVFLHETDADKMIFLDADVGAKQGVLWHLCQHRAPFVAAGVRRRTEPESYAIDWLDGGVIEQDPATKLIEIGGIGVACAVLTRKCLETFRDKTPELAYGYNGRTLHGFFACPIEGGRLIGEDIFFCRKWRELGGKVYLDPQHFTTHSDGVRVYGGCVGTWLNARVAESEAKEAGEIAEETSRAIEADMELAN